jgi:AcrR family transcriptional regulator
MPRSPDVASVTSTSIYMAAKQKLSFHQPKRPRNAVATREAMLQSALAAFSRHGYDGVGVREIAQTAGVTAVLVNRYFGSKEDLFAAAVELAFAGDNLFEGEFAELANRMKAVIMRKPEPLGQPNDALLLLLRSASTPRAAEILRDTIARRMERPLKSLLRGPRAGERAAMILALILGFLLLRRVIGCKAVSDANDGSLSGEFKMMFQQLIDRSASGESSRRQNRAKKRDK